MAGPNPLPDRVVRCRGPDWRGPVMPKTISEPGFSYCGNHPKPPHEPCDLLIMDGVTQASANDLGKLFLIGAEHVRPSKKWLTTQMELYGISFRKSARIADLCNTLEAAFNAGRCQELAPRFAEVRDRLRKRYDDAFKRMGDRMFAQLTGGAEEEATFDPARFVAKYFLGARGKPDRSKTEDVIVFQRSHGDWPKLRRAVEAVPGLAMVLRAQTVFVGWETEMQRGIEAEFARLDPHKARGADTQRPGRPRSRLVPEAVLGNLSPRGCPFGRCPTANRNPARRWRLDNPKLPEEILASNQGLCMEEWEGTAIISWNPASIAAAIAGFKEARRVAKEKQEAEERAEKEKAEVERKARLERAAAREKREEAERKARWERRSKGHTELKNRKITPAGPLTLQRLVGSYVVLWDSFDSEWKGDSKYNDREPAAEDMRLDIFSPLGSGKAHGVMASFNFGSMEGTMLLGMTRRDVELLRDMQPDHDLSSDDYDSDLDVNSRGDRADRNPILKTEPARIKIEESGTKRPLGEIADPWGVQAARAKRQMLAGGSKDPEPAKQKTPRPDVIMVGGTTFVIPPKPAQKLVRTNVMRVDGTFMYKLVNADEPEAQDSEASDSIKQELGSSSSSSNRTRVYFQYVYKHVQGYPDIDDSNEHIGYFDFDETGLTAKGVIDCPTLDKDAEPLSLFKISEAPNRGKKPIPWCKYDGRWWGRRW